MPNENRSEQIRAWQKANPEKVKAAKQKYYSSEKGKLQKQKEDTAYIFSGGRAKTEARRAAKGISEARLVARLSYQLKRRSNNIFLNEFDKFVLNEAVRLAKLRKTLSGTDWHVDHIVPVSKGGSNKYDNIQVVPALWNRQKSNKHSNRFLGN